MTAYGVLLHVAAAIALAGVVSRLAVMERTGDSVRCRMQWHGWTVAHVLIACGLVARLFRMEGLAALLVTLGLAVYFGVRWSRRAGEQ